MRGWLMLLRRLRWRRSTFTRELLGYGRLVFAGILLQNLIPSGFFAGAAD